MTEDRPFAWKTLVTAQIVTSLVAISMFVDLPTRLVWNASASVPIGLYAVGPIKALERSALVLVEPPTPLATHLAQRGYVGAGVPLLKRIEALPGQTVCRTGARVSIDGFPVAEARERDRQGRPLPRWTGCWTLRAGEVFLLNRNQPASMDGRYFGPLPSSAVIGEAHPIWIPEVRR
ncbi:S26 family signal peptidase [Brevundimonas aurifodinae]|uniref:S26 family signal peptidase n=1 Tax=Brevundimonas aurifodinae TaxID=1508312 RepID=A0ABV1NNA2_9CAUL